MKPLPRSQLSSRTFGWVLLALDATWFLFWIGCLFYTQFGLGTIAGSPYRSIHRWQLLHLGSIRNLTWMIDKGAVQWWIPVSCVFAVFGNMYTVLEATQFLSRTLIPLAWRLEIAMAGWALASSVLVLLWSLLGGGAWRASLRVQYAPLKGTSSL